MDGRWRDCKLGDVMTLQRGYDLPERERREGPVPIVSSSGVTGFHSEAKAPAPGVVTGRYGTLGEVFYVTQAYWPLNTALFVKDFKGNDPRFVAYLLQTVGLARQNAAGAVPGVNRNHLHALDVRVPTEPVQRRIADILSAYDDLIENNTQRIKVLEEMARSLYREWFVNFQFPGHENVKMVNTPLGKVPEGWGATTIGEVVENYDSKRRPLSGLQRKEMPGPYPYYGAAKVIDSVSDYIFDGRYLLVAEDGSVKTPHGRPVLQMATGKFWVNNHTHILRGRAPVSTDVVYLRLQELDVTPYVTGAAQPKITQGNLNRIPFVLPTAEVLLRFDQMAGSMLAAVDTLAAARNTLGASRDLLLPRLVSGEIAVDTFGDSGGVAVSAERQ